jgi:hypothetical protein
MQVLRQSTAFTETVGPILDADGLEYTGAVIGDLSISKNGTEAAMAAAATLTHIDNGLYTLVGTTGNSDTVGRVTIRCNKAGYQMQAVRFQVVEEAVYDALYAASANTFTGAAGSTTLGANVINAAAIASSAITSAKFAANAITSTVLASNCITSTQLATTAVEEIAQGSIAFLSPLFVNGGFGEVISAGSNDTTHVHINCSLPNDELNGHFLWLYDVSTGIFCVRRITDWDLGTQLVTVDTLPFTPEDSVDQYAVLSFKEVLTGDAYARLGAPAGASVSADIADLPTVAEFEARTLVAAGYATPTNITAGTITTVSGNVNGSVGGNVAGNVVGSVGSVLGNIGGNLNGNVVGELNTAGTVTTLDELFNNLGLIIPTVVDVQNATTTALTTALTEGYRATNATGSVRDILYEVLSVLTQASITTTTLTGYKIDGSTVAKTYTLNSATTPTSITETT